MGVSLPVLVAFNPLGRQREHILEGAREGPGRWRTRGPIPRTDVGSWAGQVDGASRSRLSLCAGRVSEGT